MNETLNAIVEALAALESEDFLNGVNEAVAAGIEPQKIVDACAEGVERVGALFEEEEYFVGDLVYASDILAQGMAIIAPLLGTSGGNMIGSMVIGTVQGDLHDIGKNIFSSMMRAAGFQVYDLGVDVPPEKFVEKIREVKPDIVGMSGLLTLSVDMMKRIMDAIVESGLRDRKILIGGNIVNDRAQAVVGSDGWSTNASKGVKQCKAWVTNS